MTEEFTEPFDLPAEWQMVEESATGRPTETQELEFLGVVNQVRLHQLEAFANAAERALFIGEAYRIARRGRHPSLGLEFASGYNLGQLKRAAALSGSYGPTDLDELRNAAWLAAARGQLDPAALARSMDGVTIWNHSARGSLLRLLATTGPFAGALLDFRKLVKAGEPPPVDFVAFHLSGHWGSWIDKDTFPEMGCQLAVAFPNAQLPLPQGEEIVGRHFLELVTPELCTAIATEAVKIVQTRLAARIPASPIAEIGGTYAANPDTPAGVATPNGSPAVAAPE